MGSSVKVSLAPAYPAFTMKPISKSSAPALVATALREEIANGSWEDRVPGARLLASRLGVSPPTVSAALLKLVEEGVLEGGGERRAFRVAGKRASASAKGAPVVEKRLLILVHEDLSQLVDITRRVVEKLRDRMSGKGWRVDLQVVDFLHVKHMQRTWDRSIEVDANTSVIAIYGRPPLAEWAVKRNVRMLFLGGGTGGLPVSIVAVRSSEMAADALAKLTELGHSRIVIPLCDRTEVFKSALRDVTRKAIEATGHAYVRSYHNPESDYIKADVTWRILESVFSKETPTAFVLLDWKELILTHCFLARRGLRVPEDVSLVLLNDPAEGEWFHPRLVRYRFPVRRIVTEMVRWLESDSTEVRTVSLSSDFVEGDSIAAPKS